jgi:hypothetical protein
MFQKLPTISYQVLTYLNRKKSWVSGGELEDIVKGHKGEDIKIKIC